MNEFKKVSLGEALGGATTRPLGLPSGAKNIAPLDAATRKKPASEDTLEVRHRRPMIPPKDDTLAVRHRRPMMPAKDDRLDVRHNRPMMPAKDDRLDVRHNRPMADLAVRHNRRSS